MPSTRPLERTATPGVYKRGSRYVVVFRDLSGRQRKQAARTLAEARKLKARLTSDVDSGEYQPQARITFVEYGPRWLRGYRGRTSRGIRPETLADYAVDLGFHPETYELLEPHRGAVVFFGRKRLSAITAADLKEYATELEGRGLSTGSVRNALAPLRALLATAVEERLIRFNPAAGVRIIPQLATGDDDGEPRVKALTEAELRTLLEKVPDEWRLFVEFVAHTGMRIGEVVALRWSDVDLGRRRVQVRRRLYRGRLDSPKSRYGRRTIPLSARLAQELWRLRGTVEDGAPVFPSQAGGMLDPSNLLSRVLKPAAVKAGVPWAGWHTLRHTCASLLFTRAGLNAKQVQVWLGHHSPAFTLATYVHLLPDDLPDASALAGLELGDGATEGATSASESTRNPEAVEAAETGSVPAVPSQLEVTAACS